LNKIWKEYGLIALLIVVSVSGYLLFSENKENIMSYTLDVLGEKMVALASDDASRERISSLFDQFSDRVANDDIAPEQIEAVAANVLNLSTRGEAITAEEAETMLYMDYAETLPTPQSPDAEEAIALHKPKAPPSSEELIELTGRISEMFELAEVFQVQNAEAANHFHFNTDAEGIYVELDSEAGRVISEPSFLPMARDMEERKLVRWKEKLAKDREAAALLYNARREKLDRIRAERADSPERTERIKTLTHIQRLGALGVNVGPDSGAINMEVRLIVSEAMGDLEGMMEQIQTEISVSIDSARAASSNN